MAQPIHPGKTAITISVIMGSAGIILALAITGAYLSVPLVITGIGQFFIDAYGILAYWLPVYLFTAALLLSDSSYRPDRIFALTASIFPFFTLTAALFLYNNYEALLLPYPFLGLLGKTGIGLSLLLLCLAEFIIIFLITRAIAAHSINKKAAGQAQHEEKGETRLRPPLAYLPEPIIFDLPEAKPLASARAYKDLLSRDRGDLVSSGKRAVDQDLERALTEAEELAEQIAREKEAEQSENSPEPAKKQAGEGSRNETYRAETGQAETGHKRDGGTSSLSTYHVPVEGLLTAYPDGQYWIIDQTTRDAAVILKETLKEFNIQAEVTGIRKGPVITMFEILPAPGVKLSRIVNLQDNIALRLAASSVRIVAPIPGKHAVGIEVPNRKRNIVSFREMIEGELHREGKRLEIPVILGKDITGEAQTIDLVQTPHLLIAGATGSGKSVCVNSMILSILYQRSPAEVRLMLIDPKIVELKLYNDIPHLLTPVITEPKRAFQALQYCIYEMERRYALLDSMGVRDIRSYNRRIKERDIATERLPYIVVVIDEFADLMATTGKELESTVARLAAMSRAVGIHLVLATQRPSIDVITGLIKANIPSRIAFMVASKMDSRIIIDMVGAEKLLGKGDMLYAGAVDPFPVRMQGAFVSEEEVERVVEYVKGLGEPDYLDEEIFYDEEEDAEPSLFDEGDDPLYERALEIVYQQGKASASYIQRRLKIGYNRAARIVEMMEERGIVGPAQGSKPRELLRGQ